ncbi:MAG: hypothetical protein KatS3mg114_1127 [Planctomycetaceae bacterium]|nr:MAG: hypothetical protein KatS3mg114_1127 [Planctomycetaceae bacterium]
MHKVPAKLACRFFGLLCLWATTLAPALHAQVLPNEVRLEALATGEELTAQPNLWVMEVYVRPLRMIVVELTDPQTGVKQPQNVWYLPYRAINRRLTQRTPTEAPVNDTDPSVLPPRFVPEFVLIAPDIDPPSILHDEILPEALEVIQRRERRILNDSVNIIRDVPPPLDSQQPAEADQIIEGVATWRGVPPQADRYIVYAMGFSNGLKRGQAPDGTPYLMRKTIEMRFWRPGDEFELREREIRFEPDTIPDSLLREPEHRPSGHYIRWIYR